ncbi:MAG: hypothetical protein ACK4GN_05530 [Runella sp.]
MKARIEIPQDILSFIDFSNTVNGGMSEPQVRMNHAESGYEVYVKSPGLSADAFCLDIVGNHLWIYHLLPLFATRPEGLNNLQAVRTLAALQLPNDVSAENIVARYDANNQLLRVFLPFDNSKRNFRRRVEVEK